jgi:adenylate kinase
MSKNKKPLFIIITGLSGSGKGTQAKMLKEKIDYEHLVMGDLLRAEAASDTELGRKINEIINIKGELVPDHVSTKLLKEKISEIDKSKHVILDGFPRTLVQANNLNKILEEIGLENYNLVVLHIKITDNEAIERLSKRRICPACREIYIFNGNNQQKCNKCNEVELIMRKDDQPDKIKKRLEWGHNDLDPVLQMYKEKKVLIEINGAQTEQEVQKEILRNIEKFL